MKTFVTFGQAHHHEIDGTVFNKDCIAVIQCDSAKDGRDKAFELFGRQWAFEYPETLWRKEWEVHFPRGYIEVEVPYE